MPASSEVIWDISRKSTCFKRRTGPFFLSTNPMSVDGTHRHSKTNMVNEGFGLTMDKKHRIRLLVPGKNHQRAPANLTKVVLNHTFKEGEKKIYENVASTRPDLVQTLVAKYAKMIKSRTPEKIDFKKGIRKTAKKTTA